VHFHSVPLTEIYWLLMTHWLTCMGEGFQQSSTVSRQYVVNLLTNHYLSHVLVTKIGVPIPLSPLHLPCFMVLPIIVIPKTVGPDVRDNGFRILSKCWYGITAERRCKVRLTRLGNVKVRGRVPSLGPFVRTPALRSC